MQLIKIDSNTIGQEIKETVNARELHAFLEVGKDFSSWMKDRIESFGFADGQDFVIVSALSSPDSGNAKARRQMIREYHLTLDMAKEVSMVERNEKGKQARQYFIECERRAKSPATPAIQIAEAMLLAGRMIEEQKIQIEQRDKLIAIAAPKAAIADRLIISDGLYNLTHAAKLMDCQPRQFNRDLNARGWIYRMGTKGTWTGYAKPIKDGYLEHKIHPFEHTDGTPDTSAQVFVTAKGMHKLAGIYNKEFQEAA